jgi:hypothetical protein
MRKWTFLLAIVVAAAAFSSAHAEDGCNCVPGYPGAPRGFLRRVCDRITAKHESDPSRACAQGKTHLDIGCTPCHAYTVFVFGSCCEFFEHPETFQGPITKCCNHLRGTRE